MKNIALTFILMTSTKVLAATDAWVVVFVKETPESGAVKYEYTVANFSELPVVGIRIGKEHGCDGDYLIPDEIVYGTKVPLLSRTEPTADMSKLASPNGWTSGFSQMENGPLSFYWDFTGSNADMTLAPISRFSLTVKNSDQSLKSGFACVNRHEAKVFEYKAPIVEDTVSCIGLDKRLHAARPA